MKWDGWYLTGVFALLFGVIIILSVKLWHTQKQTYIITQTASENSNERFNQDSVWYKASQDSMAAINDSLQALLNKRPRSYERIKVIYVNASYDSNIMELWRKADVLAKGYGLE